MKGWGWSLYEEDSGGVYEQKMKDFFLGKVCLDKEWDYNLNEYRYDGVYEQATLGDLVRRI